MIKTHVIRTLRDECGAALVEFSLLLGFLLIMTFGIIEGGYIFYQVNGAQKATQAAGRYAATRPPIALGLNECATDNIPAVNAGTNCSDLANVNFASVECSETTADDTVCDEDLWNNVVAEMTSIFPFIDESNLFITYEGTGLGYVGRGKPVPSITVELRNIQYNYVILGQLLKWQGSDIGNTFNINNVQTTVIGEDIGEGAS